MQPTRENAAPPVRDRTLWFGVGAGVIVWGIHFFTTYVLVDQVCRRNWFNFTVLGMPGLHFVLLLLTLIAIAIVATAGVLSYRHWRRLRGDDDSFAPESERYRFMTFSGMMLSTLFAALIVVTFIPSFFVATCQ